MVSNIKIVILTNNKVVDINLTILLNFNKNNMNESLEKWVKRQFAGHLDHAGKSYYFHCDFVANFSQQIARVLKLSETEINSIYQAGLCHDLLEDTNISESELVLRTSPKVLSLVKVLTHYPTDSYDCYFEKVLKDRLAVIVKLADAIHNAMITRFEEEKRSDRIMNESLKYIQRMFLLQHQIMIFYPVNITQIINEIGYSSIKKQVE